MKNILIKFSILILAIFLIESCSISHCKKRVNDPAKFEFVKSLMENPDKFDSIVNNSKYIHLEDQLKSKDHFWETFIEIFKKNYYCGFTFYDDSEGIILESKNDLKDIGEKGTPIQLITVRSKCKKDNFIVFEFEYLKNKKWDFIWVRYSIDQ